MGSVLKETVFILGGGASVQKDYLPSLKNKGYLLGINDSVFHAPCHGVFSMDRTWIRNRATDYLKLPLDKFFSSKHYPKEFSPDEVSLFKVHIDQWGLSEGPDLYGDNSGFAALNLAYLWNPKRIFLFGFDLTKNVKGFEHWYGDYPWRPLKRLNGFFTQWLRNHELAAEQFKAKRIQVYNVSPISRITSYPQIDYKDLIRFL